MSNDTKDEDLLSFLNDLEEPDLSGLDTTITMEQITSLEWLISINRSKFKKSHLKWVEGLIKREKRELMKAP